MRTPLCAVAWFVALVAATLAVAALWPRRMLLLDGSDRWRSLLLGAPPLLA